MIDVLLLILLVERIRMYGTFVTGCLIYLFFKVILQVRFSRREDSTVQTPPNRLFHFTAKILKFLKNLRFLIVQNDSMFDMDWKRQSMLILFISGAQYYLVFL